jgi:hypothetical protein
VAEVADGYPKLLVWLAEGQVRGLRNVFGVWVAVLRLIPGLRWLLWHYVFRRVACRAPWRLALYDAIIQERRACSNAKFRAPDQETCSAEPGLKTTLRIPADGTAGLGAVSEAAVKPPIAARGILRVKVAGMAAGCIGISGLRGSGKTTLIRNFCSHRYGTPCSMPLLGDQPRREAPLPGLRIVVDAPLQFEAREFLIHLYTCLCKAVLADAWFTTGPPSRHVRGPVLRPRSVRPAALAGFAFLVLTAALAYLAAGGRWPVPSWHHAQVWEIVGAAVSLIIAMTAAAWRTRLAFIELGQVVDLRADAEARLQRLHFQRTHTRSRSGTLGGPAGTGLRIGTTRELAEQAMSLPEIIDDYRDFAERVVAALTKQHDTPASDVRLVIGIDQTDQIRDPQAACKFLDEISAVFGTPNCVYLLAISPGALAAIDQRAVPLRTFSSGLFDEMVWIDPVGLEDAAGLLDQRVTNLPSAFVKLCYVLSGGLPRELLRVARAVYTTPATAHQITLAAATEHVIEGEIHALKHRTLASAASTYADAVPGLLSVLADEDWPRRHCVPASEPRRIQDTLDEVSQMWSGARGPRSPARQQADRVATEICDSFLAGLYFLLTVRYLFTLLAHADDNPTLAQVLNDSQAIFCDLAEARADMAVSPYLAASLTRKALAALSKPTQDPALAAINPCFLNDCQGNGTPPDQRPKDSTDDPSAPRPISARPSP